MISKGCLVLGGWDYYRFGWGSIPQHVISYIPSRIPVRMHTSALTSNTASDIECHVRAIVSLLVAAWNERAGEMAENQY